MPCFQGGPIPSGLPALFFPRVALPIQTPAGHFAFFEQKSRAALDLPFFESTPVPPLPHFLPAHPPCRFYKPFPFFSPRRPFFFSSTLTCPFPPPPPPGRCFLFSSKPPSAFQVGNAPLPLEVIAHAFRPTIVAATCLPPRNHHVAGNP